MLFDADWLDTIVQEHEETFDPNCRRDFIDAFLAEKKKGKDESFTVRLSLHTAVKVSNIHLQPWYNLNEKLNKKSLKKLQLNKIKKYLKKQTNEN